MHATLTSVQQSDMISTVGDGDNSILGKNMALHRYIP